MRHGRRRPGAWIRAQRLSVRGCAEAVWAQGRASPRCAITGIEKMAKKNANNTKKGNADKGTKTPVKKVDGKKC
jgi:hypothetical protein